MGEPKAEIDLSAPFASVKAAVSMFGEKIPSKNLGPPHPPHLPHPPNHHQQYVGVYHNPNHQAEVTELGLSVVSLFRVYLNVFVIWIPCFMNTMLVSSSH